MKYTQLQIIVPHGQLCDSLHANGHLGQFLHATTQPGTGYDVQTWQVAENPAGSYYVTFQLRPQLPEPARVR